jgi:hypothetical protein
VKSRLRVAIEAAILAALAALLIWHTIHWHISGEHTRMYEDVAAGTSYVGVLYNLGLVLLIGLVLGLLVQRVAALLGYRVREIEHFKDRES